MSSCKITHAHTHTHTQTHTHIPQSARKLHKNEKNNDEATKLKKKIRNWERGKSVTKYVILLKSAYQHHVDYMPVIGK